MIQSRCGLLCGECGYRAQVGCAGCVAMDKPFWGDSCPVKACCQGKGYAHCGQCVDFPCDVLNGFAYDPEQGDQGARIEQLRKWAAQG